MRYISDIEFKRDVANLLREIKEAKDPKQKAKLEEQLNYLKQERFQSELQEKYQQMGDRRR